MQAGNTSSLNFDGTGDYVNIPDSASLHIGNNLTIEAWVKADGLGSTTTNVDRRPIFSTRGVSNPAGSFALEVGGGGAAGSVRKNSVFVSTPGVWNLQTNADIIEPNVWTHIAYTKAGPSGPQNVYVNGKLQPLVVDDPRTFIDNTDAKRIGVGISSCTYSLCGQFLGRLDEVIAYNYARTQGQIVQDMKGEVNLNDLGLMGYWKFDENSGCSTLDQTGYNNHGTLGPTCSSDIPGWSTDKAGLGADLPRTQTVKVFAEDGRYFWQDSAIAETGYTVKKVDYSVNGGGFYSATATDANGAFDSNTEPYRFSFDPLDNNPNRYPGYVLEIKHVDSADRVGRRLYFEPFAIKTVNTLPDGNLEVEFSVNQQRNLLKDRLDKYVILYAQEGQEEKQLAADIPADFEQVRSSLQNIATPGKEQPADCDPCLYEDNTMKVKYAQNNSNITFTTKKGFTSPPGKYYLKVRSYNKDNNFFETQKLYPDTEDKVKSATADQLTSTSQESAKPEEEITIEEPGQKKLPGQKASFETSSGSETGPIAQIINGVIRAILGVWREISNMSLNI